MFGSFWKGILEYFGFLNKEASLILLGLDNAGKTTLLQVLETGKFSEQDSTIHPHSRAITIGKVTFQA